MKTILLPVEPNTTIESAFAVAGLIARRFGSQIEGIALKPSIVDFIAPDPVVVVMPQTSYSEAEAIRTARALFDKLSTVCTAAASGDGSSTAVFSWSGRPAIDDAGLATLSRVFDITVVGRPGLGRSEPRMTTLEAALFESGRPIIVAPPTPPRTLATNILIHWNASTETARTIHDAMPLLKLAEKVTLLRVEGNMVAGPAASDMLGYLSAYGIKGTEAYAKPAGRASIGETILSEARRIGADLLLKGAYTQSRLRQMIFGGATQHVLQFSPIPVLLSH
jgi:nucleotide-binding universal stress UspA family protein